MSSPIMMPVYDLWKPVVDLELQAETGATAVKMTVRLPKVLPCELNLGTDLYVLKIARLSGCCVF